MRPLRQNDGKWYKIFGEATYSVQNAQLVSSFDRNTRILNRSDKQLTARTGYAGGKPTDKEGRVCYHNLYGIGDYGKQGFGEVVGLSLPKDKVSQFASVYFSLFNPRTKGELGLLERIDYGFFSVVAC